MKRIHKGSQLLQPSDTGTSNLSSSLAHIHLWKCSLCRQLDFYYIHALQLQLFVQRHHNLEIPCMPYALTGLLATVDTARCEHKYACINFPRMYVFTSLRHISTSTSAKFCGNSLVHLMAVSLCFLIKGRQRFHFSASFPRIVVTCVFFYSYPSSDELLSPSTFHLHFPGG